MTTFTDLFEGRSDAYGAVWGQSIQAPLTADRWAHHLSSHLDEHALGVYPMIQDNHLAAVWTDRLGRPVPHHFVKWGCTDIDDGYEASLPLARNMQTAAELLGIDLWVERTKGKGYHCWVFAEEWIPAEVMRRALLALHQIAGVRPTEVNPKQIDTGHLKVGLGNYVNLPYAASAPEGKRVMIDVADSTGTYQRDWWWSLDEFLEQVKRCPFETLYAAASLYKPPPKRESIRIIESSAEAKELAKQLSGLAFKIWQEGPLEGRDRSTTLARLAHLMAEGGTLTPGEGMVLLRDADRRWGKFYDRADGEDQMASMIAAADWRGRG